MSTFLVVAHQTAASRELRDALVAKKAEDRRAIFVLLTPATPVERLIHSEEGDSQTLAEQSIKAAREMLLNAGIDLVQAIVGAPDPLTAIQEEFARARHTYDGIILCTLPEGSSVWLDSDLPARLESMFQVPLEHITASTPESPPALKPVIAFSVQLGSGGDHVAREVARRLQLSYYDWTVTSAAAELVGVSPGTVAEAERAQTLLERIMDRLGSTGIDHDDVSVGRLDSRTMATAIGALRSRDYRAQVEEVVRELAARGGCVIVGHAAQVVLKERPDVLKVLVSGSPGARASRLAKLEEIDLRDATRLVAESDAERKDFFRQAYEVNLFDPALYDLVLSSDHLTEEALATLVVVAAGQSERPRPTPRSSRSRPGVQGRSWQNLAAE